MANKERIIQYLESQIAPVKFAEISPHIDKSDRTLRRWLNQLVLEGLVQASGVNKGRQYWIENPAIIVSDTPAPFEHETADSKNDFRFTADSQQFINLIQRPRFDRKPCSYNANFLESYIPNETYYLNPEERDDLQRVGYRNGENLPAGTYAKKIYDELLLSLSYNSSQLEGNTYSLGEAKNLLFQGKSVPGKIDTDRVMLINHQEAIRYLVDGINRIELNEETIRSMHYILSDGLVNPEDSGHVRSEGVRIGASVYIPLENKTLLEETLRKIIDTGALINNPFEQSFFVLVHLSYLQAFIDVNKRTARLSSNIPLVKQNLVPQSFDGINKEDYAQAMIVVYEYNQVRPLVELYRQAYIRSSEVYSVVSESMGIDSLRVQYRLQRRKLIGFIVANKLSDGALIDAINAFTEDPANDIESLHKDKFIADVYQDLKGLEPFNIVGMGITKQELIDWRALNPRP